MQKDFIDVNFFDETIIVAITRVEKIMQDAFPLFRDKKGKLYFEFGRFYENTIALDSFSKVGD